MAQKILDRVKETTTTTGTGAITLAGAATGFMSFSSGMSVGDTIWYALQGVDSSGLPTAVWEVGIGTYSAANTLTRTTILASSNAGAAVTLAGTTQVWGDIPASKFNLANLFDVALAALVDTNFLISLAGKWVNANMRLGPAAFVPVTAYAFDPSSITNTVTLSNSNKTATFAPTSNAAVASTQAIVSAPTYWEVTWVSGAGSTLTTIGFMPGPITAGSVTANPGVNYPNSAGITIPGGILNYRNTFPTSGSTITGIVNGSVIGIAFDPVSTKVWFRVGNGQWNNDVLANQNPATGVGGYVVGAGGSQSPIVTSDVNGVFIYNSGDTAFANAAPAGFNAAPVVAPVVNPGDVAISGPLAGDGLQFNGTNWVNGQALPSGSRNGFVDGCHDSWQNVLTGALSAGGGYTQDIWGGSCGTGGAGTWSRQSYPFGSANVSNCSRPPRFFYRHAQTTAGTTAPLLFHNIENADKYAGKSVTVSYCLKASAAMTITGINALQVFGSGGSPSASVTTSKTLSWAITTTEQRFSVRLDIPSVSGKTLGTTPYTDFFQIALQLPIGSTFTLDIGPCQIELCSPNASSSITGTGGYPTPQEYLGEELEWGRIERLYQTWFAVAANDALMPGQVAGGGVACWGIMKLKRRMRKPPNMGFAPANFIVGCQGVAFPVPSAMSGTASWDSVYVNATVPASSLVAGMAVGFLMATTASISAAADARY
jgi:hypothetical protein